MFPYVKFLLRNIMPNFYSLLHRRYNKYVRLKQKIGKYTDWTVAEGPFKGMKYIPSSYGSRLIPKLIGSYEAELHSWLDNIKSQHFEIIVDIGCAEGYYAVGLARLFPTAKVIAFDISHTARELCAELARINNVSKQINIMDACEIHRLNQINLNNALIICDCEGYEEQLLDQIKVPDMKYSEIIVELHDFYNPSISKTILDRFQDTHSIQLTNSTSRNHRHYPLLRTFDVKDQLMALDEDRTFNGNPIQQQWAYMRPLKEKSGEI